MTADPWDLPTLTHEPPLTMEEWEAIQGDVYDSPWLDPQRFPECLKVAMEALRDIACGVGDPYMPTMAATQALRRIVQRSVSGVPFIQHHEPADSFDPPPAPRVEDRTPKPGWVGHRDLCSIQWSESCDCDPVPGSERR